MTLLGMVRPFHSAALNICNINGCDLGKVFYVELSGAGKMPVLHFGMTGMLQVGLCSYK